MMTTCKMLYDDKLQQIKALVARVLGAKNIIMKEMALCNMKRTKCDLKINRDF